jgi:uncharacterized protein
VPTDDPDLLERLRGESGLAVDAEGRFLHHGEPITHARTLEVLWRSLAPAPDGRWRVTIGRESAYVAVDETPWVVRGVRVEGVPARRITLLLAGGREAPLRPETLRVAGDGVLRGDLPDGTARFSRAGHLALGALLEEDPPGSGTFVLPLDGRRHPVRGHPQA